MADPDEVSRLEEAEILQVSRGHRQKHIGGNESGCLHVDRVHGQEIIDCHVVMRAAVRSCITTCCSFFVHRCTSLAIAVHQCPTPRSLGHAAGVFKKDEKIHPNHSASGPRGALLQRRRMGIYSGLGSWRSTCGWEYGFNNSVALGVP